MRKRIGTVGLLAVLPWLTAVAAERPAWMSEGPAVDTDDLAIEVPVEVLAGKLYLAVEVGGVPRRFVFDTGSPSMLDQRIADELGLAIVDRTQGRDAHGAIVDTTIVQADLGVGGTVFRKVPVFVADFPRTARCLFDGVLGSELLSLCAWQIDLPDGVLRCHGDPTTLDHTATTAAQPLYTFGYPHAPYFDIRLARSATSKAMFDTGAPGFLALSPPDLEGARNNRGVSGTVAGAGSLGGSLGGRAPDREQVQVILGGFGIGPLALGETGAVLRESPPSLIGAAFLEHFVVTLDQRSSTAWFAPYRGGPYVHASHGFGLSFEDGVRVSLVWERSPAARAGLTVGQAITAIDGAPVPESCEGIRGALRTISRSDSITLGWESGEATLSRERPGAR